MGFPVALRLLFLGSIFSLQCLSAAVLTTRLHLKTLVKETSSPFPVFSGDKVTFHINVIHSSKSYAKAVDAVVQVQIPFYLTVLGHNPGNGIAPSSVEKPEASLIKYKFNNIKLSKSVTLSLDVAVDPYFSAARNGTHVVAALVDLWYYGENDPCDRPPSLYNAQHETARLPLSFVSTTACDKRIAVQSSQYFASSMSGSGHASYASFYKSGVWMAADSLTSDRNQFLQIDLWRLMKISKIATRGQTKPFLAFVRTYHLYHSKNFIEWSAYHEESDIKVFTANRDGKNVAFCYITLLVHARYLRIVPRSWKRRQALDVEVFGCHVHPREDLEDYCPIFDFENGVYGWEKAGTAFDNQPTVGDNRKARTGKSSNIQGNGWIATAENRAKPHIPAGDTQGDAPVGTLTSPKFLIITSTLYFLIGGTRNSADIRAELLIDGNSVRAASADNEQLKEGQWDVKSLRDKEAMLRLVDNATDGHLNFDSFRVNCFLDGDAQNISLPSRAVMLNAKTHSLYVCDSSHFSRKDVARCRVTSGSSDRWTDIPDVHWLLGVDSSSNLLYAVSKDRYVITSVNPAGGNWQYIKRSEWEEAKWKATMVNMSDVPLVTVRDGVPEEILLTLSDSNGDKWRATTRGISHKPAGQDWVDIAAWSCQVSDVINDPCFPEPCENRSNCTIISRDKYNCSCLPGYSGVNCEQDIDECLNNNCQNGGTCVHGINYYFCRCPTAFSGTHCENVLPTCRTSPCLHGGTCIDETPPAFLCTCTSNYKGTYCEIAKERCLDNPCKNGGVCVANLGGYKCVCQYGYYGSTCASELKTNFEIVQTATVTEKNRYLVIKARIPSHGTSLTENWCRDYEKLCSLRDREPTGYGHSYNHIREYASCQEQYHSIMDRDNVLGATPNEKVSALAQQAGFADAAPHNSFAFNACDGRKCSRVLPETGCDEGLSCISKAVPNLEVYTVCIESNTYFTTFKKKWEIYQGVRVLLLNLYFSVKYSKFDTWCTDYEIVCQRYGLRPIGYRENKGCEENHRAIIHTGMRYPHLENMMNLNYGFLYSDCSRCSDYCYNSYYAMDRLRYHRNYYAVACTYPQGIGFKVLDDQKITNYSGSDYMAVKVQVPLNGRSNGTNWCKDYQLLCESYSMVPRGCRDCVLKYGSVCSEANKDVQQILHNAGFSDATTANTFIYKSCLACSDHVIETKCHNDDLFCIHADNIYRVFYTVCMKAPVKSAFEVRESRSIIYQSFPYTVISLYLPENRQPSLSNWCEDYQALCESIGGQPVGCGPSYTSDPDVATCGDTYGSVMNNDGLLCGDNTVILDIVDKAGFNGYSSNTFMFHNCSPAACTTPLTYGCSADCSCHPALACLHNSVSMNSRNVYTVCHMYSSAFKVLETKTSSYSGHEVLVVKAEIPSNGVANLRNWCEEYKSLCYYYGYRPTGCGEDFAGDMNYASCRHDYASLMPADNVYGCPATGKIAYIARTAGFLSATTSNTFGFSDCNASCISTLTAKGPFIDLSVTDGIVHTICETSDSHFKVMSTKKAIRTGGEYLLVEAQVPEDLTSKHESWCTDYQRMCESFGMRPVAMSGFETIDDFAQCRNRHGAISPKFKEANYHSEIEDFGEVLGYNGIGYSNSFVFREDCDYNCYSSMSEYNLRYALESLRGENLPHYSHIVYTVCASSDSNFYVISTKEIAHKGQDYLVIMAKLPSNRESKYENWCRDYERLCRSFRKRPTGCGLSYQWSSKYTACVDKYQSAMAEDDPVGCNSSESVANLAYMAGFFSANRNNSFAFHQCSNERTCPKRLTESCPDSLPCLTSLSDVVYTVCTDSSSAFIVERVQPTWDKQVPLLFITATLNGVTEAKSEDWCTDYRKLCESYAARPVGCYSDRRNDAYAKCANKYSAVPLKSNGCEEEGTNDIYNLKDITPNLEYGDYFKYHKCSGKECRSTLSNNDCNDALYCLKDSNYVYTVCSRASHNFDIIETASTSHGELEDILVVHANVPSDGRSLYDSWCEDYTKMCSIYGKVPLACPLRHDYIAESLYRSCSKDYNGYMLREGNEPCPMNKFIADIAKQSGFPRASTANTLMLTTCLSCLDTLHIVNQTNQTYLTLSCPANSACTSWQVPPLNRDVYMLCVKPRNASTFHVDEVRYVEHESRKYAALRVSLPYGTLSMFNDWCRDYQKMCESISMRPIACGSNEERLKSRRLCRSKYNAVLPRGFDRTNYDNIAAIARSAGFHYNTDKVFSLNDCSQCWTDILKSSGVDKIASTDGYLYTACTNSDSSFEVLQTRDVIMNDKSYFVIKAQLPVDMTSSYETWCKDYQMMCESYGKRPLTCSDLVDCRSSYNSLLLDSNCNSLHNIPQRAGFVDATQDNTFVFKYYQKPKCSRRFPDASMDGPFGRVNSSVAHRLVYTVCLNSATAFEVLASKNHIASGRSYLFLQVAMPKDGTSKYASWCHDYTELCREYGHRPVTCLDYSCRTSHGAIHLTDKVCPISAMLGLAESAGISITTSETNFLFSFTCTSNNCRKVVETRNCTQRGMKIPQCFDREVNEGEFTTVCAAPTDITRFPTLDWKFVTYSGRFYAVIRTQKRHRDSLKDNWCIEYRQLCVSFAMRPLACPTRYNSNPDIHLCQRSYHAVSMETEEQGCPMNEFVAELARHVGFKQANPQNSFALQNCHADHCKKTLPVVECSEALYCMNTVGEQEDLYTACVSSDSGFRVQKHRTNVNYNSVPYGVIKVTVYEDQRPAHEDWCKDYQRLCESYSMEAVQCQDTEVEPSSDICTNNYLAFERLQSCKNDAKNIATKAKIGHVADKTTVVMNGCRYCTKVIAKSCSSSLDCLRSGTLYAICAMTKQTLFKPTQAQFLTYGSNVYLLVQNYLRSRYSYNFMDNYDVFCGKIYGYKPIACGRHHVSGTSSYQSCVNSYENALSSQGDDFGCPAAKVISHLANKAGFYQSMHKNTFAFHQCTANLPYNRYYGYYVYSPCSGQLWCLNYPQYHSIYYTMCARPQPSPAFGFNVLDKKELEFLGMKYVAFKLSIGSHAISATGNWCYDYRELCRRYNLLPTGCGTAMKSHQGYLKCSTIYRSFMSERNSLGCGNTPVPSSLIRRAGFPDAQKENTFVFNDCNKCVKNLQPTECDSALNCLYSNVFNAHAYTLCADRKSGFEYLGKSYTIYGGVEYLVVESALPVDNRALYDSWCVDYQKLCYSLGSFPVACSLGPGGQDVRRYAEKYGAVTVDSISCPPHGTVVTIVKKAGYTSAGSENSFIFTGYSSYECSKNLPSTSCTPGLSCLNSKSRKVYAVCTNPTNFAVSAVRKVRHSGNVFTVVQAKLPASGLSKTSSWCEEYATLCRSMKQQPVVCPRFSEPSEYEKCRDNYGGYLLLDSFNCINAHATLHEIPRRARFPEANLANTFGLSSCSACQRKLHSGPECDPSLSCINNQTADRRVYALCVKGGKDSNFQIIDTKEIMSSNVQYMVVMATTSPFGRSKYDTWCTDYERMCSTLEMRPVRCSSAGNTCPLLNKALVSLDEQFDCKDNSALVEFVKNAGFLQAATDNTFIFSACSTSKNCGKTLSTTKCSGPMHCLKKSSGSRPVYTLCARSRHTNFKYLDARTRDYKGTSYFVVRASLSSPDSKGLNWCYDYRDMCMSFGKQPVVLGSFNQERNDDRNQCFGAYNATSTIEHYTNYGSIMTEISMSDGCRVVYKYCKRCIKNFSRCPFDNCGCTDYYIFCL